MMHAIIEISLQELCLKRTRQHSVQYALYSEGQPKNCGSLWRRKYKTEDVDAKKFIVDKFLDFKMVDSKIVMKQIQKLQSILHDICS